MQNKDLFLEDGTSLKWFSKGYETFFNKTTLLYGRTRSGKSTLIIEIMYLLKDHISSVFVISKSNAADFVGRVPKKCIKHNITKEWLEKFLVIQKGRADLYNKANDMKTLKFLFEKIKTPQSESMEHMLLMSADKYISNVETNPKLEYSSKIEQVKAIQEIQVKKLVELYKKNIRSCKHILDGMKKKMTHDEICCLNYIDFVPHALLIFDDCASVFKKWVKESTVIKEIFYAGRWSYITFIITSQDDKEIEPELRKNAMVSFFTTPQAAIANFTRGSNSYTKYEKTRAEICVKKVFKTGESGGLLKTKNFKKLVYIQDSEDPFLYTIADIYGNFKMGCPALWELTEKMESGESKNANEDGGGFFNEYYNM